jgi:hypothetical protein
MSEITLPPELEKVADGYAKLYELAANLLSQLESREQLITRLTEALRNVTVAIIAVQDNPDARFSTETKKAIREADAVIRAVVAKERAG